MMMHAARDAYMAQVAQLMTCGRNEKTRPFSRRDSSLVTKKACFALFGFVGVSLRIVIARRVLHCLVHRDVDTWRGGGTIPVAFASGLGVWFPCIVVVRFQVSCCALCHAYDHHPKCISASGPWCSCSIVSMRRCCRSLVHVSVHGILQRR